MKPSSDPLALIRTHLELLEEKLQKEFSAYANMASELAVYAAGGRGKRLRPVLLFLSGKLFGAVDARHVDAAAAIELIHTATLVHDDIIDEAEIRRQKPSLNAAYGPEFAVMTGDLILSHAIGLLVNLPEPGPARTVAKATQEVCEGEILQTHGRFHLGITEAEYFEVIDKKTAALFDASCRIGAELSGATPEAAAALGLFGRNVGLAFQIVDDCLDIVGEEEELGKSLGTDMKKGKLTLPFIRMLAAASAAEKMKLEEILTPPLTPQHMRQLREALKEREAVEEAIGVAMDLVQEGKKGLQNCGVKFPELLPAFTAFAANIFHPLKIKFPALTKS